jgi:hypothetical protein
MQKQKPILVCAALALAVYCPAADKHVSLPEGIEIKTHTGWANSLFLNAPDPGIRAVVVPAIGGRIVHYSLKGENIIFENPGSEGKTLANTKEWFWVGGYQCDLGPELRGIPDHNTLWVGQHEGVATKDFAVAATSQPDAALGIQMGKEIVIDPETGQLGITQWMKNISDQETSFCLWDRTLCKGGGFAFFPLNKKSRFPAKWSLRHKIDDKEVYDGKTPASPNVKVIDGVLVAKTTGSATKVGADSDAGWIAYARGRLLFVKFFPYVPTGQYSDGGNSVELYFDQSIAELEPLSPEVKLKPGETYAIPEQWVLIELKRSVTTFEQARALVKQVPRPPFRNSAR